MSVFKGLAGVSVFLIAGCLELPGDPAAPDAIAYGLADKTVYRKVHFEGYLENAYIYHRPNGTATYFRQVNNTTGYTKETRVGSWSPGEGQVCYKWKSSSDCKTVNVSEGRLVAAHGEIRPRDIGGTQRRNGVAVWQSKAVRNAPSLGRAIANSPIGSALAVYGRAVRNVCGANGCADTSPNTSASAAWPAGSGVGDQGAAAAPSGFVIRDRIQYSTGQQVIARGRCNSGKSFNVRYYPGNGNGAKDHAIYSLFGSSIEDVASRFCR